MEAVKFVKFLKWKLSKFSLILHALCKYHDSGYLDDMEGILVFYQPGNKCHHASNFQYEAYHLPSYFQLSVKWNRYEVKIRPTLLKHSLILTLLNLLLFICMPHYFFLISDTSCGTANYLQHKGKHIYLERLLPRQNISQISYFLLWTKQLVLTWVKQQRLFAFIFL